MFSLSYLVCILTRLRAKHYEELINPECQICSHHACQRTAANLSDSCKARQKKSAALSKGNRNEAQCIIDGEETYLFSAESPPNHKSIAGNDISLPSRLIQVYRSLN
jgi:hypothetical protein